MSHTARDQWLPANQRYLTAAIEVVQSELQYYQASLLDNPSLAEAEEAIAKAKAERGKAAEALPAPAALEALVQVFGLSPFEEKILLMCAGMELNARFAKLLQAIQNNPIQPLPTFSLALSAFSNAHWSALTPGGPLRYWRLVELSNNALLTVSPLSLDEHILHYLTGIDYLDLRLQAMMQLHPGPAELAPSHQQIAEALIHTLSRFSEKGQQYPLIQMTGSCREDKTGIAAAALSHFSFLTYAMPLHLLPLNLPEIGLASRLWNRMAALSRCALFLDGSYLDNMDSGARRFIAHFIDAIHGIVILGSDHREIDVFRGVRVIEVKKPLSSEQQQIWKESLGADGEEVAGQLPRITAQFDLDAHAIRNLAQSIVHNNETEEDAEKQKTKALWSACCRHTRPQLDNLAQRIEPVASWEDLVLPEVQKSILKDIGLHVRQRQKVYYEWGFAGKSTRGLGISALFSGESGTGKTMASEVLANELGMDLYRIDLSQVVNKYIGETEKNLKKIFDAAEESGAILLFDEADALFGKRSEVKDSHDRYSNIEVSYLLQKMEAYRGLAILTTNMKSALDKAFLRRIRFIIHFPFPDAGMRAEIWKRVFPRQTPTKSLDLSRLAALNITGGNIRNIALNATFLAADENRPVSMNDIYLAARNEYAKLEKPWSNIENFSANATASRNIHR